MVTSKGRVAQGFTWIEAVILLGIVAIVAAVAIPSYQNYTRRAYFNDIISTALSYKTAVAHCYQALGTVTGCNAGSHAIPRAMTRPNGLVLSLAVADGVITVIPMAKNGLTVADTYILTPDTSGKTLNWVSSGGAVINGYAK